MTDPRSPQAQALAMELLSDLVAVPSVSSRSNLGVIELAEARAAADGAARIQRLPGREPGKAALLIRYGDPDQPRLILSGHSDVVPADDQDWSGDPFTARRGGDRIFGRGTADMKGFLACALVAAPALAAELGGLAIAISYDEELGCSGAGELIQALGTLAARPLCIVGEPTGMVPVVAHKGIITRRARFRGSAAHSSLAPLAVNAVELAAILARSVAAEAERQATQGPRDPAFDVPHSTLQCGILHGGTAVNIVAERARLEWDLRWMPGEDPDSIIRTVEAEAAAAVLAAEARVPGTGWCVEETSRVPAFRTSLPAGTLAGIGKIADALQGRPLGTASVGFATEAGLFEAAGFPSLVWGPGSIEQAHRADEYVTARQIGLCLSGLAELPALLA